MPNWCYNSLSIEGKTSADISKFMSKYLIKDNSFDFDKIIPEPKDINDCPVDCRTKGNDGIEIDKDRPWFNWYEWRHKFWGVKWNASDVDVERRGKNLYINFNTPWSPPRPIIEALRKQNPNLYMYFDYEVE